VPDSVRAAGRTLAGRIRSGNAERGAQRPGQVFLLTHRPITSTPRSDVWNARRATVCRPWAGSINVLGGADIRYGTLGGDQALEEGDPPPRN